MNGLINFNPPTIHKYETTEKVVGRWIDNKPVYENYLTGNFPTPTKSNKRYVSSVEPDFTSLNVSQLIWIIGSYGILFTSTNVKFYNAIGTNFVEPTGTIQHGTVFQHKKGSGNFWLQFCSTASTFVPKDYILFFQYTKTTD